MYNFTNTTSAPLGNNANVEWSIEPVGSHVFRLILYAVIFLITFMGNIFVIAIVLRTRELHSVMKLNAPFRRRYSVIMPERDMVCDTVTGYLICNLSIADLGVGLLCIPFTLTYAELTYWPFGLAMCKLIPSVQAMLIMASVATLSAISFDRFRSIAYPYEPRISVSKVKLILVSVWIIAAIVGLPFLAVMELQIAPHGVLCDEYGWPTVTYRKVYTVFSFFLTYGIPLPLMATWYAIVVYKLEQAAKETSDAEGFKVAQAKGKVIRMLIVVVAAYFLCFLPFHVLWLWNEFGDGWKYKHFWVILSYSQVLVYANSCINPILYCFFSNQFRRGFIHICQYGYRPLRPLRRFTEGRHSRSLSF